MPYAVPLSKVRLSCNLISKISNLTHLHQPPTAPSSGYQTERHLIWPQAFAFFRESGKLLNVPLSRHSPQKILRTFLTSSKTCHSLADRGPLARMSELSPPPKLLTLLIVHKLGKVLLGRKKRGFGEGYFNGFGGKVEPGETIEEAAIRELKEEAGVEPVGLESRGILTFHFDDQDRPWEVHVYHAADVRGEPYETDEMEPIWFAVEDIPFSKMWADDPLWYPIFLQGKSFKGTFHFQNTHTMVSHEVHVLQKVEVPP